MLSVRILYADLEFQPEERFSLAARMLLQGMIKRDPSTRLGAWENPPQDIMSAPFFDGIQWDAIYERRFDGPYVPEVPSFGAGKSKSSKALKEGNESPAGGSRGKDSDRGCAGKGQQNGQECVTEESEEEDGEDSESELKGMRDSVFIRPHDGGGNNLLDWSFIDEKVLAETYAEGDSADPSKTGKKLRRKKKRAVDSSKSVAATEVKISEEIENNKVGFAAPRLETVGVTEVESSAAGTEYPTVDTYPTEAQLGEAAVQVESSAL